MATTTDQEPLCYQWCGLGLGLCLRNLGHEGDCDVYPDVEVTRG